MHFYVNFDLITYTNNYNKNNIGKKDKYRYHVIQNNYTIACQVPMQGIKSFHLIESLFC